MFYIDLNWFNSNTKFQYRNINLIVLSVVLMLIGVSCYAVYFNLYAENPVREGNLLQIVGTLESAEKLGVETDDGVNIRLAGHDKIFSPLVGFSSDVEDRFFENEHSGSFVDMTVNRRQFEGSGFNILGIEMTRVDIFQLSTPKEEYLFLDDAKKDFAVEKRYSIYALVICSFSALFLIPFIKIKKNSEIEQGRLLDASLDFIERENDNFSVDISSYKKPLEFNYSRNKKYLALGSSILLFFGSVLMIIIAEEGIERTMGIIFSVFMFLVLFVLVKQFRVEGPIVKIDEAGIEHKLFWNGILTWQDIESVEIAIVQGSANLSINLYQEDIHLSRLKGPGKSMVKLTRLLKVSPFSINFVSFTPGLNDALEYIKANRPEKIKPSS